MSDAQLPVPVSAPPFFSLLEELVQDGELTAEELQRFRQELQVPDWPLAQELLRLQLVSESQLIRRVCQRYRLLSFSDVLPLQPPQDQELAGLVLRTFQAHLFQGVEAPVGVLTIESRWEVLEWLEFQLSTPVRWCIATRTEVAVALGQEPSLPALSGVASGANVQAQLEGFLEEALEMRGSDLHLDPAPEGGMLRVRVDGRLRDHHPLSHALVQPLTSRIKLQAGMDIAVRRRPQDGHFTHRSQRGRLVDVRVSTMPGLQGEKLVLRLLDQSPVQHRLDALGFLEQDLPILDEACRIPSGLILLVGPTGSGKTTTLYAMLRALNSREKHIFTIEHPVEYEMSGITQVSVQPEAGLGFADALRAALRQDPDVLLVGEIRDEETASIALKAALTGHLVLSTLHSHNAVTTIQRLTNLGISIDLLADTLHLVVAQRLVRKRCAAREHQEESCPNCRGTGYFGRTPVYEVLRITPSVQERIRRGENGERLVQGLPESSFRSLHETARQLVEQNVTDWQEVEPALL